MPQDARASALPLPAAGEAATRGVLLVVLAAGFWSLSGILVRLIEVAGPWQIILLRSLSLTATMLLLMMVGYGRGLGRALARAGWDGLLAGVSFSLASGCFILAVQHTTVANALFMAGIAPFVTALLGRWLLAEPVAPATWGGLVLCALGVAVMVGGGVALEGNTGNALALVSAIAFALFSFFLRRGRQSDMLPAILASGVISAGLALLMLLAVERLPLPAAFLATRLDLALCLAMGAIQLGLGSICYARGARHVPVARLQLVAMLELVLSPLWVWLIVAETPSLPTLVGGALVLLATGLQAVPARRS